MTAVIPHEDKGTRGGEVGTVVLADGVDVEADLLGEDGFVHDLVKAVPMECDVAASGGCDRLGEGGQPEFHGLQAIERRPPHRRGINRVEPLPAGR